VFGRCSLACHARELWIHTEDVSHGVVVKDCFIAIMNQIIT
jgi:hypothetical protein